MTVVAQTETTALGDITDLGQLTPAERKKLGVPPEASPFYAGDRLFGVWQSGQVFDYGDASTEGIRGMLESDGTARQIEQVLTLPIRGADWSLEGGSDKGRKLVTANIPHAQMELLIAQQTSAAAYRKAFFELQWLVSGPDVRLAGAQFLPAWTCQAAFTPKGHAVGFRQRSYDPGGMVDPQRWAKAFQAPMPGWVPIPRQRAYIYTHGVHREPLRGVSDLAVAWWAYETRRKLLFLWLQYVEQIALPKVAVYGRGKQAEANAKALSRLTASGFVGVERGDDPAAKMFELVETGQPAAAAQFRDLAVYLEQQMVDSVLAGFTKLASGAATTGAGSYALSADQSEFFLGSRQAVADEIALQTSTGLFAPLCIYNGLGPEDVPQLRIGPLSRRTVDQAMDLVKTLIVAPQVNAPEEFLDSLLTIVAPLLGLDPAKLEQAIEKRAEQLAQQAAAAPAADDTNAPTPAAGGKDNAAPAPETGGIPTGDDAVFAHTVAAATDVVELAQHLGDADAAADLLAGRTRPAPTVLDLANGGKVTGKDDPRDPERDGPMTGGMIALYPTADTARKLALRGDQAERPEELHITLAYLGDDVTGWTADEVAQVLDAARDVAAAAGGPVKARVFAHTTFNPDGHGDRQPCAVYLVGDSPDLVPLHAAAVDALHATDLDVPEQHKPFVPHVTAGYDLTAADLKYTGPVIFDRVVVALAGERHTFPLTEGRTDD